MANVDAPFGLRPVRYRSGQAYTGACRAYFVTGDNAALHIGDPVVKTGTANTAATHGFEAGFLPAVTRATAGATNRVTGVVVGFLADDQTSTTYRVNNTSRVVLVADDPDLVYHIQDDGTGSLGAATVGLNAVFVAGTGSTVYGRSKFELDGGGATAPAADATYQMTILGLAPIPGNELADFAVWEVAINLHTEIPAVAGL